MRKNFILVLFFSLSFLYYFSFAASNTVHLTQCGKLVGNTNYILDNDVRSDGTCFFINGRDSSIDLNGHTITYADMVFTGVINPGFEEQAGNDPTIPLGWDLSGAHGHAYRQDYLKSLFYDSYSLHIDNIGGDANKEESVLTSPVYLPLPGKYAFTVEIRGGKYGSFKSKLAIEGVEVTCSSSVSGMHTEANTDMSWGLICEFNITEPQTVRGKVILQTTDETKNTYLDIDEADIRPIDDLKGGRLMGMAGIRQDARNASLTEIKNGSIIEGRSKAIYSSAILNTSTQKIHDLTITTNGMNSSAISEVWAGDMEIYNNYLEVNGKNPLNRQYGFSIINLERTHGGNKIYNNTLMNGPHIGINHGNKTGGVVNLERSEIYNNTIKTKITATNGFAISAGSNLEIYNNIIDPFQGHGIGLGPGSDDTKIHDNIIKPKTWPCSEYSSASYTNAAHGIRIKNYAKGIINNLEIYNNTIIGSTNPQFSNCYTNVNGITNYLADDINGLTSSGVKIHDNNVSVETDDYNHQYAVAYTGLGQGEVYNNTFKSNHIIVGLSNSDGGGSTRYKRIEGNTLIKDGNSPGFYTFHYGYFPPLNNEFIDSILQNGADLKSISFGHNNGGGLSYGIKSALTIKYKTIFIIKDVGNNGIDGVSIELKDKNGIISNQLITGLTGSTEENLTEYIFNFQNSTSSGYIYYSPYSLTIKKDGYITKNLTLITNKRQTLSLILDKSSVNSSGTGATTITGSALPSGTGAITTTGSTLPLGTGAITTTGSTLPSGNGSSSNIGTNASSGLNNGSSSNVAPSINVSGGGGGGGAIKKDDKIDKKVEKQKVNIISSSEAKNNNIKKKLEKFYDKKYKDIVFKDKNLNLYTAKKLVNGKYVLIKKDGTLIYKLFSKPYEIAKYLKTIRVNKTPVKLK